jgi:hypothetical protein
VGTHGVGAIVEYWKRGVGETVFVGVRSLTLSLTKVMISRKMHRQYILLFPYIIRKVWFSWFINLLFKPRYTIIFAQKKLFLVRKIHSSIWIQLPHTVNSSQPKQENRLMGYEVPPISNWWSILLHVEHEGS